MEKLDRDYMTKVNGKLSALGIPCKTENQLQCMIFNEIRDLNLNIQTLLDKLEKKEE